MAEKILTDNQIIENLSKDVNFGIQFVVQNQPNTVIDRLKELGYDKAHTIESAYKLLIDLYKVDPEKVGEILNNIPYNDNAENYTGGLGQHFFDSQPSEKSLTDGEGVNWGGILAGAGALLSGIGTSMVGGSTLTTQQQQQLMFQQQQQQQMERERRQRNAMLWGVIAVIVLVVVVIMYKQSSKKAKKG